MASVEEVCDKIALVNNSKIILQGTVAEIQEQFQEEKKIITKEVFPTMNEIFLKVVQKPVNKEGKEGCNE